MLSEKELGLTVTNQPNGNWFRKSQNETLTAGDQDDDNYVAKTTIVGKERTWYNRYKLNHVSYICYFG